MKQQIFRIASFIFTFVVALIVISAIMNNGNTDLMVEMKPASLPLVYANVDGYYVNQMQGYIKTPKAKYFRESLTPLPENRKLYLKIDKYGTEVKDIMYEVRSIDADRLIESTQIYDYIDDGNQIIADFSIKDLIERNQEYILVTILKLSDGREVRYYTRIVWFTESSAQSMIKLTNDFHTKSFSKDSAKDLTTYLESNSEGDNSTYGKVNIHSSFSQVAWGDLDIVDKSEPQINICEMDSSTASIVVNSIVTAKEATGNQKHYIREYFRMRAGEERTYLLDYERTMDQFFYPTADSFSNDVISLGITSENVSNDESLDGNVVLFVQENSLYAYNSQTANLSRLFSFYDDDNFDERTVCNRTGIKVINVDETGNTRFLIYGYNPRGRHEGDLGISLYYYDIGLNTIQEEAYIPYDKSFSILKSYIERMSYINRRNDLFLYIDEAIYKINIESKATSLVVGGLCDESFVVSKSNQLISWKDDDEANKIKLIDLNSGNESQIECAYNQIITPLGFVGEDLVYGLSDKKQPELKQPGNIDMLISKIVIQDKNGTILKEYGQDDTYVTDVAIYDKNIRLKRIKIEGENYYPIEDDQITCNIEEEEKVNKLRYAMTQDYEKVTQINLAHNNTKKAVNLQTPGEMLFEGSNEISIPEIDIDESRYYVYLKGNIEGVFVSPEDAINLASELAGTAVRDNEEYIWQRGKRNSRYQIRNIEEKQIDVNVSNVKEATLKMCVDAILSHEGVATDDNTEISEDKLKNLFEEKISAGILELKGCDLNTILYYVDKGIPVIADAGLDGYVLITGFDEMNITILDPKNGTIHKVGMNDSADWFENNGNKYITYMK